MVRIPPATMAADFASVNARGLQDHLRPKDCARLRASDPLLAMLQPLSFARPEGPMAAEGAASRAVTGGDEADATRSLLGEAANGRWK